MDYNCLLTVDCVVFFGNAVVLIKRKNPPYQGYFALPGGFVENDESVEEACVREAQEETNLELKNLIFIGAYSAPRRDPRGRVVSFAFLAEADLATLKAGDDASQVYVVENWENMDIAFDHLKIIKDAVKIKNEYKLR